MTVVTNPAVRRPSDDDTARTATQDSTLPSNLPAPQPGMPPDRNRDNDNAGQIPRDNSGGLFDPTHNPHQVPMPSTNVSLDESLRRIHFSDELGCDVIFVAGINNDTIRYPAHRKVLQGKSPAWEALLSSKSEIIVVDYVDRRGFEQLMRYQYDEEPKLNSVLTARYTMDAAYKFMCPLLMYRCTRRLDEILDAGVALEIMPDLRYMCARLPGIATAPPPDTEELMNDRAAMMLAKCSQWVDALAHNVLLVLDDNADAALTDERLEDLSYEDLALIVKRPTFRVSDEFLLVEALYRWATAVCKKHNRELTSANRRTALGELSYTPRYLLMRGEKLDRALAMELLAPMESKLVLAKSRKLSEPMPVGAEQENMLRVWGHARPAKPAELPVRLSPRSTVEPEETGILCMKKKKQVQQPNYYVHYPEETELRIPLVKEEGCCKCFGEGLLRAFICLFD